MNVFVGPCAVRVRKDRYVEKIIYIIQIDPPDGSTKLSTKRKPTGSAESP